MRRNSQSGSKRLRIEPLEDRRLLAAPVAADDSYFVFDDDGDGVFDGAFFSGYESVLVNDYDADQDALEVDLLTVTAPVAGGGGGGGSVLMNTDGSFNYDPPLGTTAPFSATFTYQATDNTDPISGLNSADATVTIVAWETPTITVGDHELLPDTPGQTIDILVSGVQEVAGVSLYAQIADGGIALGGVEDGPAITGVDFSTGIFAGGTQVNVDDDPSTPGIDDYPMLATALAYFPGGMADPPDPVTEVPADGVLVTLTIDTTGFGPGGAWDLELSGVLENYLDGSYMVNTDFARAQGHTNIINGTVTIPAEVVGRYVFYNDSYWDGNDAGANVADDSAIAPSPADLTAAGEDPGLGKTALLPGETATFQNYTSYGKGINGVMVDVQGLGDAGGLSAADFTFEAGNSGFAGLVFNPTAPADIVDVRAGAGVDGSDRVTLIWNDANAVQGLWLRVTVAANANTGLADPDVFYFGSAPGETGNVPGNAAVDGNDAILARDNTTGFFNPPALENPYDFDRSHAVNGFDAIFARDNTTGFFDTLALITAPSPAPIESAVGEGAPESLGVALPVGETANTSMVRRESINLKPMVATEAIDTVLADGRYLTVQNTGQDSLLEKLGKKDRQVDSLQGGEVEELLPSLQ